MKTRKIMTFVLAAMIVLACRVNGHLIDVTFESLSGLEKGDRVLFQGNTAGQVKDVQFNQDGSYTVRLEIEEGFANAVTEYSRFYVVGDPERKGHKSIEIQLERQGGTPLASGSTVKGTTPEKNLADRLHEELEGAMGFLKEQMDKFGRDIQTFPESQEYKDLKKSLQDLADEIERKEKETREKVKREWLPKIQRELDDLRERLRQMDREDQLAPLDQEVERIRRM